MTPLLFTALAVAGGVGAAARMLLDGIIRDKVTSSAPWGTITINLTGSLLFGLLVGTAATHSLPDNAHHILATGLLGGYTTFSTASVETIRLLQDRRLTIGLLNGLGTAIAATALAGLGLWLPTAL